MEETVYKAPRAQEGRIGLVLEGGGMRGIYTAGVLDVFMENGIGFDGVMGVSAGAIHGCSLVSGQRGRSIRYYKKYCWDKRFMSWQNFFRTGDVVDEKFCYHDLPERLDPYDYEAFNASDTAFYVTCTNVETGKPEYLRITDMKKQIDLMRASASLPYASRIVEAGGKKLLDGGCSDSIPVRAFQRLGYGRNVVVLTRPEGYVKKPERRGLARVFYRRYPAFVKALESRPETYNRTVREIGEMERAGEVFVIRPSEALKIGRMSHDREEVVEAYKLGRRDAKKALGALKIWLGEKSNG